VGFPNDEVPAIIQFQGSQNGTQFWQQNEVLSELRAQLHNASSDGIPRQHSEIIDLPPPPPQKTSWFGRKSSKAVVPVRAEVPAACPVTVHVLLDEINFRSETEYGLFETFRAKVVMAVVDVR
jgi:hypothetical protein